MKKKKTFFLLLGIIILGLLFIWLGIFYYFFVNDYEFENIEPKLYCPNEFDLIDDLCYKRLETSTTINYYCNNDILEGDKCVNYQYYPALIKYNCPFGYYNVGSMCRKIGSIIDYSKCYYPFTYYFVDNMCYPEISASSSLYCNYGTLYNNQCVVTTKYNANYNIVCPDGYIKENDSVCVKIIIEEPLKEY